MVCPCLWFWSGTGCVHDCDFSQHTRGLTLFSLSSPCPVTPIKYWSKQKPSPLLGEDQICQLDSGYQRYFTRLCVFWFRRQSFGALLPFAPQGLSLKTQVDKHFEFVSKSSSASRQYTLKVTQALISWFKLAGVPLLAIISFYILNFVTEAPLFYVWGILFAPAFSLFHIGVIADAQGGVVSISKALHDCWL